jgi:hypothetical protein
MIPIVGYYPMNKIRIPPLKPCSLPSGPALLAQKLCRLLCLILIKNMTNLAKINAKSADSSISAVTLDKQLEPSLLQKPPKKLSFR